MIDISSFILDNKVVIVYQQVDGKFVPVSAYCWLPTKK